MSREKKGKTQKSTVTLKQAWDALVANGFSCVKPEGDVDRGFRTSRRRDGRSAQAKFGADADVSRLGRAVTFHGNHADTGHPVSFTLNLSGETLGHGELQALKQKTGIKTFNAVANGNAGQASHDGVGVKEPQLVRQRGTSYDRV